MHSWEVVCVDQESEGEVGSCRAITTIGYLVANSVRKLDPHTAALRIDSGNLAFHIYHNDDRLTLQKAGEGTSAYVRTMDTDSPNDPLLSLPSINEFEAEQKREQRGF